jgi:hypothetical protein
MPLGMTKKYKFAGFCSKILAGVEGMNTFFHSFKYILLFTFYLFTVDEVH